MSVKSCEKLEKSQVALTIEVGAAEFQAAIEKAYQKMRKKINVPGFRPGKAPRKVIEGMYGAEVFFEEAINIAFPDAYEAAVKEQELQVVGYPAVEMVGECTKDGFTFKATAPVYPEVTLGEYKGLSAPKDEVKVTAADVDERLKELSDRNTRLVSAEREAKEGDTVVIDFEGFLDGKPFDGGKGENHSLELGSHSFVPGFEEQLVGTKAGDEKDLDITFPEDYHADLAGKAVVFKVKVHEVKEKQVPALDDEFAKDVSEFDTLDEYKQDIEKHLKEQREKAADNDVENQLVEAIIEKVQAEIPDEMVENEVDEIINSFAYRLQSQGLKLETYLKYTGQTTDDLRVQYKPQAERQVKVRLGLEKIAELEGLKPTEEETEAEYQKLADAYGMPLESVKNLVTVEGINGDIQNQKAIDLVKANAVVVEKKAEEEQAEEKKPAKKRASTKKKAEAAEGEEAAEKPKRRSAKKAESAEEKTEG